jgi:hypothetical protein
MCIILFYEKCSPKIWSTAANFRNLPKSAIRKFSANFRGKSANFCGKSANFPQSAQNQTLDLEAKILPNPVTLPPMKNFPIFHRNSESLKNILTVHSLQQGASCPFGNEKNVSSHSFLKLGWQLVP